MVQFVIEVEDAAADEIRTRAAAAGLTPEAYLAGLAAPKSRLSGRLLAVVDDDLRRYRAAYQRLAE